MTDPDLEIRAEVDHSDPKIVGGGGRRGGLVSKKKKFASVWSKSKKGGGGSDPRVPPLDPPQKTADEYCKA